MTHHPILKANISDIETWLLEVTISGIRTFAIIFLIRRCRITDKFDGSFNPISSRPHRRRRSAVARRLWNGRATCRVNNYAPQTVSLRTAIPLDPAVRWRGRITAHPWTSATGVL